jgi:hypothetical protein
VTNLEVTSNATPTTGQTYLVEVEDNTAGTTLLSCTVTSTSSPAGSCQNTGTASVTAGHYLQVQVTNGGGAPGKAFRVTVRY